MDDLLKRRWDKDSAPDAHKPIDAVKMFLHRLETGELNPNHVIMIYSNNIEDKDGTTGYFQAGDLGYLGQMGLITRALHIMNGE